MALSSNDAPRTNKETAKDKPSEVSQAPGSNHRWAAESSDPEVHRLLAERQTAAMNDDDEAVAAIDKQLDKLAP